MLKNNTAMITGCNRGIGKSTLNLFAKNNCNIIACVRKITKNFEKHCKELENSQGISIKLYEFDIQNEKVFSETLKKIILENKAIDILVNNAAIISTNIFQLTSEKVFKEIFEVNFFSTIKITQIVLKSMIKLNGGSIINISSISADDGNIGRSAYSASKSALQSLTKVLSRELGRYKIRVNSIAPGLIDTEMLNDNTENDVVDDLKNRTSLKRLGKPEEVANLALFLASDLSSYVTGQVIRIDGGL